LQDQNEILDQHNEIRRSVTPTAANMVKMVWSEKAAEMAQKWADKCEMTFSPSKERVLNGVVCGENVLMSSNQRTWPEIIAVWQSQSSNFKYGRGATTKNADIENYTQMIWYNSYQIGCAVAHCPTKTFKYFYVCEYCPAGNNPMQIDTPYKSGPQCADCPGHCDRGLCTNPCKYYNFFANCESLKNSLGCDNALVKDKCSASSLDTNMRFKFSITALLLEVIIIVLFGIFVEYDNSDPSENLYP
ncbi:PREDICTED: cysteine-rich venom protein TEL1-like, partial [Leptosomus discolor]|uniref:cysteine-rich venom protein TEL1-like n=1 Tax=Leptosomus discolor TaxID=188344 RepID=UPI000522C569